MMQRITGTLLFLEARALCKTQKDNTLLLYGLRLFVFCLLFHVSFFLPHFFSVKYIIPSLSIIIFFSLLLFSILLFRIIILIRSPNELNKVIEFYEKDRNSFVEILTTRILMNLAVCSVVFISILLYFLLVYGVYSLFISPSLSLFLISFLIFAVISGVILYSVFLYSYLKKNDIIWPKIILPIIFILITFFLLSLANLICTIEFAIIYIYSFTCGWFFTYPLLKRLLNDKKLIISYRFILFCYVIILILFFISSFSMDHFLYNPLYKIPFIQPITTVLSGFTSFLKTYIFSDILFIILFPHLFVPILLVCKIIYDIASLLRQKLTLSLLSSKNIKNKDLKNKDLKKEGNTDVIYSSGLSFYPLFRVLFRSFIIAGILFLEILPLSDLIYSLIQTFRIPDIFHLTFLIKDNILFFLNLIWYVILAVIGLQCLDKTIMHLCSTFVLLTEEISYKEIRLLSKSVIRIPLKSVHYVMYHQNICERFFNIGTIHIEIQEKSDIVSIKDIPCIKEKYNTLLEKVKQIVS